MQGEFHPGVHDFPSTIIDHGAFLLAGLNSCREWSDRSHRCSGVRPSLWARFEHSATLVAGGILGASRKQTIVVVGGVTGATPKVGADGRAGDRGGSAGGSRSRPSSSSTGGGNGSGGVVSGFSSFGGPESTVVALDVETLTWYVSE
jgi:hypothetical protein